MLKAWHPKHQCIQRVHTVVRCHVQCKPRSRSDRGISSKGDGVDKDNTRKLSLKKRSAQKIMKMNTRKMLKTMLKEKPKMTQTEKQSKSKKKKISMMRTKRLQRVDTLRRSIAAR